MSHLGRRQAWPRSDPVRVREASAGYGEPRQYGSGKSRTKRIQCGLQGERRSLTLRPSAGAQIVSATSTAWMSAAAIARAHCGGPVRPTHGLEPDGARHQLAVLASSGRIDPPTHDSCRRSGFSALARQLAAIRPYRSADPAQATPRVGLTPFAVPASGQMPAVAEPATGPVRGADDAARPATPAPAATFPAAPGLLPLVSALVHDSLLHARATPVTHCDRTRLTVTHITPRVQPLTVS